MDWQKNIFSSQTKLSALAWMMFFAPLVKHNILQDDRYSEDEKKFVLWYVQIWFINLVFLIAIWLSLVISCFTNSAIFSRITTICSCAIWIIIAFCTIACINDLSMRNSNESIMQPIQHKDQLLKAYCPIWNFILWFRQTDYSKPYRWLKESIILWTAFIFWTLLLWSSVGLGILIIIAVRVILLLMNIDIIPLSMKNALNSAFYCNLEEIFTPLFSSLIAKVKKSDREKIIADKKIDYTQWEKLWLWITIQYTIFLWILVFLYHNTQFSWLDILLWLAIILWIARIVIFHKNKKTFLRIPILSEITDLIFH